MSNAIRTLTPELTPEALRSEILHTLVRLEKDQRFPTHLAAFQALEAKWWLVHKKSILLRDTLIALTLDAEIADQALNQGSDEVAVRMDKVFANREHPVFVQHFGHKRPSVFRRPLLGTQLDAMDAWPVSLAALPYGLLSSYAPTIAAMVDSAKTTRDKIKAAESEETTFYIAGDYKKLVDEVNAARGSLFGDATAHAHSHPELLLSPTYPISFFLRGEQEREPTLAELDQGIASAQAKLTRLQNKRKALIEAAELAQAQQKEAEKQAKLAMLAEAQKQAAEVQAQVQSLQAEVEAMNKS